MNNINNVVDLQEYTIKFGKYSGEDISNVPRKYLNWLLEELEDEDSFFILSDKDKEELLEAIEEQLQIRDRSYIDF